MQNIKIISNYKKSLAFNKFKILFIFQKLKKLPTRIFAFLIVLSLALSANACVKKQIDNTEKPKPEPRKTLQVDNIEKSTAYFVTPDGKDTNNGDDWQNAMDLQTAINSANVSSTRKYVLVAEGVYYTDSNPILEDRKIDAKFTLKNAVKIYGGFDVSLDPDQGFKRYADASILEGKLSPNKNSEQIFYGQNLSDATILDGFVIQNILNSKEGMRGTDPSKITDDNQAIKGAMELKKSYPKLVNLTFKNNQLTGKYSIGAAIVIYDANTQQDAENSSCSPTIINSKFIDNSTVLSGGAVYNSLGCKTTFKNTVFINNKANTIGGAIYSGLYSQTKIINSVFIENSAYYGGAIYNDSKSKPSIVNNVFFNNIGKIGGAISNKANKKFDIYNSILWNNYKRVDKKEVSNIYSQDSSDLITIYNSILNSNSIFHNNSDLIKIDMSNQMFATQVFSLNKDGKVADANKTSVINMGVNSAYNLVSANIETDKDLDGNSRLKGNAIDIGAFEVE